MSRCESVNIIVLLSKAEYERGKYVISIDVVSKKKAEALIKIRAKGGFELAKCLLNTGRSPVLDVTFKEGKYPIVFEVAGALKPVREFMQGENVMEFSGKSECQKITTLDRNPLDSTTNATITFSHAGNCLHRVTIDDVPGLGVASVGIEDTLQASLTLSDGAVSGRVAEHMMSDSASSVGEDNQAVPLPPRPQVPDDHNNGSASASSDGDSNLNDDESNDNDDDNDCRRRGERPTVIHASLSTSSFRDNSACGKALSDESLNVLAAALSPQDANRLIAGLGVPDAKVKQERGNNAHDVVQKQFELLKHWRHRNAESTTDKLYAALLKELSDIGRNDIKLAIEVAVQENRKLAMQDFNL